MPTSTELQRMRCGPGEMAPGLHREWIAALVGVWMRLQAAADQRADRAHGDDGPAPALLDHPPGRRLDGIEGAVIIDLVGAPHDLARHVEEAVERADAGIADQHVDTAEGATAASTSRWPVASSATSPSTATARRPMASIAATVSGPGRAVAHDHVGTLARAASRHRARTPREAPVTMTALSLSSMSKPSCEVGPRRGGAPRPNPPAAAPAPGHPGGSP
ncbi:MAG: hypothetical protein U1E17_14575 [Geminicoccaceae bacterium]